MRAAVVAAASAVGANRRQRASSSGSCQRLRVVWAYCALVCSLAIICIQLAECQFFTKSSSKSIPRMGRRSPVDSSPEARVEAYRRLLIDRLVDEFGASLFNNLVEAKLSPAGDGQELVSRGSGEIYLRNDQPFDLNVARPFDLPAIGPDQVQVGQMGRNERSEGPIVRQVYGKQGPTSKSLAMRAFTADRLLQHLASGGSPMLPYERLIDTNKERNTVNSNGD